MKPEQIKFSEQLSDMLNKRVKLIHENDDINDVLGRENLGEVGFKPKYEDAHSRVKWLKIDFEDLRMILEIKKENNEAIIKQIEAKIAAINELMGFNK